MNKQALIEIVLKAIDKAGPVIDSVGGKIGGLGGVVGGAQKVLGALFTGLVTGATLAIKSFEYFTSKAMDFEESMSGVKTVLALTAEQFGVLSDLAIQLGKETIFSAAEVGKSMEMLARMGLTFEDIANGAQRAVLNLAAATKSELEPTARTAAAAINIFGVAGKDLESAVDGIANAVNRSGMSMWDYSFALKQGGLMSKEMGLSLDDLNTTLAVFARQGLRGESAGSMLNTMLSRLVPSTEPAITAFRELGLIVGGQNQLFDESTGKMKSWPVVIDLLTKSMAGLTTEQKANYLHTMFGIRAQKGVIALFSEGVGSFKNMQEEMHKLTASELAKGLMNNLAGDIERFRGSWETAAIAIGTGFLPVAREVVTWGEHLLNALMPLFEYIGKNAGQILGDFGKAVGEAFGMKPGSIDDWIAGIEQMFAGLDDTIQQNSKGRETKFPLSLAVDDTQMQDEAMSVMDRIKSMIDDVFGQGTGESLQTLIDNLPSLLKALADLVPWVIAVAQAGVGFIKFLADVKHAIDDATAGFQLYFQLIQDGPERLTALGMAIGSFITSGLDALIGFKDSAIAAMGEWGEGVKEKLLSALTSMLAFVIEKLTNISGVSKEKWEEIRVLVSIAWDTMVAFVTQKLSDMLNSIKLGWDAQLREISQKIAHIVKVLQDRYGEMVKDAGELWDKAKKIWSDAMDAIAAQVGIQIAKAQRLISEGLAEISRVTGVNLGAVQRFWNESLAYIQSVVTAVTRLLQGDWSGAMTAAKEAAEHAWGAIKSAFSLGWQAIKAILNVDEIVGIFNNSYEAVKSAGRKIVDAIKEGIDNAWTAFLAWLISKFAGAVGSLWPGKGSGAGQQAGQGFANGFAKGMSDSSSTRKAFSDFARQVEQNAARGGGIKLPIRVIGDLEGGFRDTGAGVFAQKTAPDVVKSLITPRLMQTTRQGRGGFRAASGRNFWDQWSKWHGLEIPKGVEGIEKPFTKDTQDALREHYKNLREEARRIADGVNDLRVSIDKQIKIEEGRMRGAPGAPGQGGGFVPGPGVPIDPVPAPMPKITIVNVIQMGQREIARQSAELEPVQAWRSDLWAGGR